MRPQTEAIAQHRLSLTPTASGLAESVLKRQQLLYQQHKEQKEAAMQAGISGAPLPTSTTLPPARQPHKVRAVSLPQSSARQPAIRRSLISSLYVACLGVKAPPDTSARLQSASQLA